jgi:hypothetical protein
MLFFFIIFFKNKKIKLITSFVLTIGRDQELLLPLQPNSAPGYGRIECIYQIFFTQYILKTLLHIMHMSVQGELSPEDPLPLHMGKCFA